MLVHLPVQKTDFMYVCMRYVCALNFKWLTGTSNKNHILESRLSPQNRLVRVISIRTSQRVLELEIAPDAGEDIHGAFQFAAANNAVEFVAVDDA